MSQTKAQLLDNIKDDVQLDARKSLRFGDTDSSHYVAFKAPATVSSNVTWTLPAADGSANYVLATDGSGTLSWIADPAGQWVTSGNNVYYTAGNVGIGDNSPSNPLSVTGASAFNGDVQFTGANYGIVWDKSDNAFEFDDNTKATFGTGSDLSVYHSGSHSFIKDSGTGNLQVWTNQLSLLNSGGTESMIQAIENGEVQLYFDNSEKLNTDTDGVNIAGTLHFADDANTHFSRAAADVLTITTAGSERLRVDASGNVGIGVTGPGEKFDVVGNARANAFILRTNASAPTADASVFRAADNTLAFATSNTERVRVDVNGYVGINQTPSTRLDVKQDNGNAYANAAPTLAYNAARFHNTSGHVSGGVYTGFQFNISGDSQNRICSIGMISEASNSKAASLVFHTDDGGSRTEKLRLNSSGHLLVGATSDVAPDSFGSLLQVDSSGAGGSISVGRHTNSGSGPMLLFHKSRSGGAAGTTVVQSGDSLGGIRFFGADGTDRNSYGANISCEVDTTPGGNDMPGRLIFSTTSDGAASSSERLRIDSAGRVIVGNGTHAGGAALVVLGNSSTPNTYSCAAFGRVGSNPTSGTQLVNLRFSGGSAAAHRAAEINVKAAGNWTEGSDQPSELSFHVTADGASSVTERLRIKESGEIWIPGDNQQLRLGAGTDFSLYHDGTLNHITANNNAKLKVSVQELEVFDYTGSNKRGSWSGDGIKFGSDTAAANGLNDYEEGTWTMTLGGTTTAPSYTAGSITCNYRKVGKIVHFGFTIQFSSWTDGAGTLTWSLPFAAKAGSGQWQGVGTIVYANGFESATGDGAPYGCYVDAGNAYFYAVKSNSNTATIATDQMATSYSHHYIGYGTYNTD